MSYITREEWDKLEPGDVISNGTNDHVVRYRPISDGTVAVTCGLLPMFRVGFYENFWTKVESDSAKIARLEAELASRKGPATDEEIMDELNAVKGYRESTGEKKAFLLSAFVFGVRWTEKRLGVNAEGGINEGIL